jgi:hypothetical protein
MARLILATLAFSLIVATSAVAQVKITIPAQQYKVQEQIRAKAENVGNSAVTFCVEFGQTSMKNGEVEGTRHHHSWCSVMRMEDGALC